MSVVNDQVVDFKGIDVTNSDLQPNALNTLSQSDNAVHRRNGMPERRSGFGPFSSGLPATIPNPYRVGSVSVTQMWTAGGSSATLFAQVGTQIYYYDNNFGEWLIRGSYAPGALLAAGGIAVNDTINPQLYIGIGNANFGFSTISLLTGNYTAAGNHPTAGPVGTIYYANNALYQTQANPTHTFGSVSLTTQLYTQIATLASVPVAMWVDVFGVNAYVGCANNIIYKIVISSGTVSTFATMSSSIVAMTGDNSNVYAVTGTSTLVLTAYSIPGGGSGASVTVPNTTQAVATDTNGNFWLIGNGNFGSAVLGGSPLYTSITTNYVATPVVGINYDSVGSAATLVGSTTSAVYSSIDQRIYFNQAGGTAVRMYVVATNQFVFLSNPAYSSSLNSLEVVPFYQQPDGSRRPRTIEYNGNTYITSANGIIKCEGPAINQLLYPAGVPKALDLQLTCPAGAESSGFLTNGNQTAYRHCWIYRDGNNNLITGAPSQRSVVQNPTATGHSANVKYTTFIPNNVLPIYGYQVYRTLQSAIGVDPGDEEQLVYESAPTSADLAAGYITFTDITGDSFLAAYLYTNQSQQGIAQENDIPPLARDMCIYKDSVIYANCSQKQTKQINLVGTSTFVSGTSTITIGGTTYHASSTTTTPGTSDAPVNESISSQTFVYYTSSSPSLNIEYTAKSLVRVINRNPNNPPYYAYYVSSPTGTPGQIVLTERGMGAAAFAITLTSEIQTMFSPTIPTSGTSFISTNNNSGNTLYIGKQFQPDHVPIANSFTVGGRDQEIQRVVALRDSVIIWKDRSVWRLVGDNINNFVISLLDASVGVLISRDSVAIANNIVYGLTSQGLMAVTDTGTAIISTNIENRLIPDVSPYVSSGADGASNHFIGIGNEADHSYILSCTTNPLTDDGGIVDAFCYNYFNQAFDRWYINANCFTTLADRVYWGTTDGYIVKQRRGYDGSYISSKYEFADDQGVFTISAVNTSANTAVGVISGLMSSTYARYIGFGAGWVLVQGGLQFLVLAYNAGTNTVTLNNATGLNTGTAVAYQPIPITIQIDPRDAGNQFELDQWSEIIIACETQDLYSLNYAFFNETDTMLDNANFNNVANAAVVTGKLLNDFTSSVGPVTKLRRIRELVPAIRAQGCNFQVQISNNTAISRFSLLGVGNVARSMGTSRVGQ